MFTEWMHQLFLGPQSTLPWKMHHIAASGWSVVAKFHFAAAVCLLSEGGKLSTFDISLAEKGV